MVGYDGIPGFADYVLGRANVLPEDIIMIGSVSGYNYFPVDLALKANAMGCATVALTSVEYSSHLTSKHPSGKRLFEACTYCIDNCTNYGDTLVDVPELGQGICPASGVSASYHVGIAEHRGGEAAGQGSEAQRIHLQPYARRRPDQRRGAGALQQVRLLTGALWN